MKNHLVLLLFLRYTLYDDLIYADDNLLYHINYLEEQIEISNVLTEE